MCRKCKYDQDDGASTLLGEVDASWVTNTAPSGQERGLYKASMETQGTHKTCLLYTSDAADDRYVV